MTHPPSRSARPLATRCLTALLLAAVFCGGALSPRPVLLGETPAPLWLAGDDDKGGVGVG